MAEKTVYERSLEFILIVAVKRVLGENIEVTIPGQEKGFFAKLKRLFKK